MAELSAASLREANTRSKTWAAVHLADPICTDCGDWDDNKPEINVGWLGRTDYERFAFSGVQVEPARLQAYSLNY